MEINLTKKVLKDLVDRSKELKSGFKKMVIDVPQILEEEDLYELKKYTDELAANFDSCALQLYTFGRMGTTSKKFAPTNKTMIDYTKYKCLTCEYRWTDHDQYLTGKEAGGEECPECHGKEVRQVTVSSENVEF